MDERAVLDYDMFRGDETDVRVLSDRFVTTRKPHRCVICWDRIPVGARVRAQTERNNEAQRVATFYACVLCCEAMALSWADAGEAIEFRTGLGVERANSEFLNGERA